MAELSSNLLITLHDKVSGPSRQVERSLKRVESAQRSVANNNQRHTQGMTARLSATIAETSARSVALTEAAVLARAGAVAAPAALAYGGAQAYRDFASMERQLTRTGLKLAAKRTHGRVIKTVAKQMGTTGKAIRKRKGISTSPASSSDLTYTIAARDGYMPLKDFGATQRQSGVSARPWGKRRIFGGMFIVPSIGGHVFKRDWMAGRREMKSGMYEGQKRHPILKRWGPSVPREIVRDEARKEFETFTQTELPKRVAHQIARATKGVID